MSSNEIVVSISCITYNHAPYIRQCLDGFMMQQTDFAFEVLIHDDASTDGTTEIIKEYEAKYPDIIKPIYEEENQWVKGRRGSAEFNFPRAKGKYIAMCEGDDYWTDPLKLQKQVDFLESNASYSICGHRFVALDDSDFSFRKFATGINGSYELSDLITKHVFCSTLSIVFRKSALDLTKFLQCRSLIDIVLAYMLLKGGKGYCLPDEMAVYRKHGGGIWSMQNSSVQIYNSLDARFAIYELERTKESAMFIRTYIQRIGRLWMLKNYQHLLKALRYIKEQFGVRSVLNLILNLIFR